MKHKLCSSVSPLSFKLQRLENGSSCAHHNANSVSSLFDLSAKVVAEYLPFEYVERTLVHIPEPVQEKIIFYSFPRRDSDIYTYASFHPKGDKCRDKIPYYEGLDYFQNDCVEDVIQIGFHLTGSVKHQHLCVSSEMERRKYEVSITFDRCKIISVCCDCGNKGLSWCPHVVALALFRIRNPHLVDYRSPISVCIPNCQVARLPQLY
ncbi:SWIM zinc finger domain protein [Paragonimus skrjabini miyazakii]|uniref:SWIM zinc finger domain protein n=1 Tax=Paragonimus skrjabini miyazakii TaxID=59628 RepID=A0A8S9YJ60_9TREM|nr:SWIM zinc finger domain protein [Paragonimus skrjabini miyazakii]